VELERKIRSPKGNPVWALWGVILHPSMPYGCAENNHPILTVTERWCTLTELDELNARVILRGTSDQRNNGTLTAGLPFGARHAVLMVQVENNSCTWSLRATRHYESFPQP
jgi:hypothetical protein